MDFPSLKMGKNRLKINIRNIRSPVFGVREVRSSDFGKGSAHVQSNIYEHCSKFEFYFGFFEFMKFSFGGVTICLGWFEVRF